MTHGKTNTISYSDHRQLRTQKPNIIHPYLFSEILNKRIKIPVTTTAYFHINKIGGLDNYLLNTSDRYINSHMGMLLKKSIKSELKKKNSMIKLTIPKLTQNNPPKERNPKSKLFSPYVYVPTSAAFDDVSPYSLKIPNEMTRAEKGFFERIMVLF